jgi:haloacetate dehalogenase
MFEGFTERQIATGHAQLHARIGGSGPPLVCLHGYPQTHLTWRKVAGVLAERYTVILPDLRGYGQSEIPPSDETHMPYSKRVMAGDIIGLMSELGHQRFFIAGHDRGARVAYRLALDAPERVAAIAVLDVIPTVEMWEAMDYRQAYASYHWQFLAQPEPLPEKLIGVDPAWYCRRTIESWLGTHGAVEREAMDAYVRAFARPEAIHAACEDYRAGFTRDAEIDRADRDAGRRITAPLLALWGSGADGKRYAAFADVWHRWATNVTAAAIACGHFLMEEAPGSTGIALRAFFDAQS